MKKSIATNTFFYVIYKVLNMLFPLVTSVYLARVLGPTYVGKVSYAQSILSYFTVVASLGIPTYGMREIAKVNNDSTKRNKIFSELFILNLFSSIVCSLVYSILILCVNNYHADIKLFFAVGLTLYLNIFNIDWFYSGQEEYVYISVRSLIIKIISLGAILFGVKNQSDYITYALITSVATTGNYVWNVINLRNRVKITIHGLDFKIHLKPVLVLLMTSLATDLYNQVDITMLGIMCSDDVVGYYSNGIRLIRMINTVTTAISATILPRMCLYYKEKKKEKYKELFWVIADVVIVIALPCTIGIILVAEPLVKVLFGIDFLPTVQIIQWLAPIILIISVSYLVGSVVLTSTNNERYLLRATITGSVTNVLLNALLIPFFSTIGAVVASLIGETAVFVIHFKYGRKYIQNKIDYKYIGSVVISSVVMAACVVGIQKFVSIPTIELILSVGIGAFIYVLMLFILHNPVIKHLIDWAVVKIR